MKKVRATIGIVIDTLGSLIIYGLIAGAILFMAGQAKHYYDVGYGVFSQQGKDAIGTGKVVLYTVEEGATATKVGADLEAQGIVESARLFVIQEKVSDYSGKYVVGTYALSSEMTTEQIMRVLSATEPSPYTPPEEAVPAEAQPAQQPAQQPAAEEAPAEEAPAEEEASGEGEEEGSEEGGEEGEDEGGDGEEE